MARVAKMLPHGFGEPTGRPSNRPPHWPDRTERRDRRGALRAGLGNPGDCGLGEQSFVSNGAWAARRPSFVSNTSSARFATMVREAI
jgi:hypothetical protein